MKKTKTNTYTADDIDVLNERDHVRLRTPVYLGNTARSTYKILDLTGTNGINPIDVSFVPAAYKAVGEIFDNALDEYAHVQTSNYKITITADPDKGMFSIADTGRGIPIEKKKYLNSDGKQKEQWVPEVLLSQLRSGRNFRDGDDKNVGVIGMNGVGAACTNYCSSSFKVTIVRDGKRYVQEFTDGAKTVSPASITSTTSKKTGTEIQFTLDPAVFKEGVDIPREMVVNRAIEMAATNPGIEVILNLASGESHTFKFKNGISDVLKGLTSLDIGSFTFDTPTATAQVFVIPKSHTAIDEQMFAWVNSSYLYDGGKCNTQFMNAFFDKAIEAAQKKGAKSKIEVTKNDVRYGLTAIATLKLKSPMYDSQAKTRLTGPDLRREMVASVDAGWKVFAKKFDGWLDDCVLRAALRQNKQASSDFEDDAKKKTKVKVPGLLDATSRVRSECMLFIVEGESAKSQICEVRDPNTMAAYPLTGKFNNIRGQSVAQVSKMGKIVDLLKVIGLVPGKPAIRSQLNYGKLIISTDADYDGGDIFANMVNLIHAFWPELLSPDYEPYVYRMLAPNVCLVKGDKRVHFATRGEYEAAKDKYKDKGWTVNYYKGLGSMAPQDWEMILSGQTKTEIPIVDDGKLDETMELLFGNDADARKDWLQGSDE
jgi:DNA gyrase/topoisomerase IV subunit B